MTGLSGSRRRNGNTKFLLECALEAGAGLVNEINEQFRRKGVTFRVQIQPQVVETYFEDHNEIIESVRSSDALLLGSPVYFGSISPNLNELLREVSDMSEIDLSAKVAGSVAIGTQRNGGQETAIQDFWGWYLDRNITFVGNGPVTSQYGGTAWGGARHTARRDVYGVSTTRGTGKRLVQDAIIRLVGAGLVARHVGKAEDFLGPGAGDRQTFFAPGGNSSVETNRETPLPLPECRFLFFADASMPNNRASDVMRGIESAGKELANLTGVQKPQYRIDFLSMENELKVVKDCAACAVCPPGNKKIPGVYGCIYDDDLNKNFHRFYDASAIVCVTEEKYGLVPPKYWVTLNRMRSVRRNDYMLTGRIGAAVCKNLNASQIPLKWLIRNNLSILSTSRENPFEFGRLLFRETLMRQAALKFFEKSGVNIWTPPTHHE